MKIKLKSTFLPLLIAFNFLTSCAEEKTVSKPNIILIYADDLGIGMLGHEGQKIVTTPNIDMLASEGIRFVNSYSNMLCAPARASLISGLHDCHKNGFEITNAGIYKKISIDAATQEQIEHAINSTITPPPHDQLFLGQIAQKAGYKTAQFGKLEWGFAVTHKQMERHGWDYYLGYYDHVRAHGFYPPFLFENGILKEIPGNTLTNCGKSTEPETAAAYQERWNMEGKKVYSQDLFTKAVLDFIHENKDQPFFLYYPTQLPHGPVSVPKVHPDFKDDDRLTQIEKEYASMVKMLDDHVGLIVQELQVLDLIDNTIIIFTADNGHEIYYAQEGRIHKPVRNMSTGKVFDNLSEKYYSVLGGDVFDGNGGRAGLKRSNLQGGINVPLIIRWPDKIKAGRESDLLVANYDILATLADITHVNNSPTDGISFINELTEEGHQAEHDFVVYSSWTGPALITNDGWKIRTYLSENIFELYHLRSDKREEVNLARSHPEKLAELKSKLLQACSGDLENGQYSPKNQIAIDLTE